MTAEELQAIVIVRLQEFLASDGALEAVVDFTGANRVTVQRWKRGMSPPRGDNLIKVWVLLKLAGFESPEMAMTNPFVQYIAELLAFGRIDAAQATDMCGLKNVQSMYVVLRGQNQAAKLPEPERMADIKRTHNLALTAAKDRVVQTLPRRGSASSTPASPAGNAGKRDEGRTRALPRPARSNPSGSVDLVTLMFASQLKAVMPMAEFLNSDACTDAQREQFRQQFGPEAYESLFMTLSSLRGRKAREWVQSGGKSPGM